jgi:hypothetical protein
MFVPIASLALSLCAAPTPDELYLQPGDDMKAAIEKSMKVR